MGNISFVMPVIGAIGTIIIVAIILIVQSAEKQAKIKSVEVENFYSLVDDMKRENAEMRKDLYAVKEKVEAIDKMMKDI